MIVRSRRPAIFISPLLDRNCLIDLLGADFLDFASRKIAGHFVFVEAAAQAVCSVKIVFSRRGNTDYKTMKDYLILMRDGKEVMWQARKIVWDVLDIDSIAVENHSKWAGLQIADCITSAFFNAIEPNVYGNYEPTYAKLLKPRLIKTAWGSHAGGGLTPVPSLQKCNADAEQTAFFNWFDEIGRPPAPVPHR